MFYQESEYDNIEYKKNINYINEKKIQHYATQINYRLINGNGICYLYIGIEDSGKISGLNKEETLISFNNLIKIIYNLNYFNLNIYFKKIKIIYNKKKDFFYILIKLYSNHNRFKNNIVNIN